MDEDFAALLSRRIDPVTHFTEAWSQAIDAIVGNALCTVEHCSVWLKS